ncbi:SAM-dependent methyltransferase [Nocardia nova]|uniref:SAM-dependent methyltransferase n=1 Tax=Nocardia nova TaxID=37330 RepID=UPI0037125748
MADDGGVVDLGQDRAHSARIYDYYLGGRDNYEADRTAAAAIEQAIDTGATAPPAAGYAAVGRKR